MSTPRPWVSPGLTVWLVDGNTRLHLPSTQWGKDVVNCLQGLGHLVENKGLLVTPDDSRSGAEKARMDALLDETGL